MRVLLIAGVSALRMNPADVASVLRQRTGTAKTAVDVTSLNPACADVECADVITHCSAMEVVWEPDQCCPVCQDPGFVPGRIPSTTEYRVMPWEGASMDQTCRDVKCFRLNCPAGQVPSAPTSGCCLVCAAGEGEGESMVSAVSADADAAAAEVQEVGQDLEKADEALDDAKSDLTAAKADANANPGDERADDQLKKAIEEQKEAEEGKSRLEKALAAAKEKAAKAKSILKRNK